MKTYKLTTSQEIEERVAHAIRCALDVYYDNHGFFNPWAHAWLDGTDRSAERAAAVADLVAISADMPNYAYDDDEYDEEYAAGVKAAAKAANAAVAAARALAKRAGIDVALYI